jgi:uncharacterized protein|tara:strand:+ start:14760 stop:15188 length:429 start_codon:yes stop_codon:yes gene_type:complete
MAIEIKIPTLDFEKNVAIGLDIPLGDYNGSGFVLNYTTLDQAVANAKVLLLTNHGERPMRPTFGCNLRNTLFENIGEDLTTTINEVIVDNFELYLPYIKINELLVDMPISEPNRISISMSISLKGNETQTRQINLLVDSELS